MYLGFGLFANCLIIEIANAISNLVSVIAYIKDPTDYLYQVIIDLSVQ